MQESEIRKMREDIQRLTNLVSNLEQKITTHQHGGSTGGSQIYNESVILKPGLFLEGTISTGKATKTTISSGSIRTLSSHMEIDTEGAAASDDLDRIDTNAARPGMILVLRPFSSSRTIVVKDGTGNLRLAGDFSMDHSRDTITLIQDGGVWYELARSNNDS